MPPNEFQHAIDIYKAQQPAHQEFDMLDSSSEGSFQKTTTSRGEHRRRLQAKERETFHKEMREYFNSYKGPICL